VRPFTLVGFDADDTLWHSEDGFEADKARYLELLQPFVADDVDILGELLATERRNLAGFGYGVRSFGLSMIETAVKVSNGTVPATVIGRLVELTRGHLDAPVRLLPDVMETIQQVRSNYRVVLITKGDLLHQTQKIATSGLADLFEACEVVLEKDSSTYGALLARAGVPADQFCMVGNSVRSDIVPVMDLGGHGVHVPYHLLWELEHHDDDHPHQYTQLESLIELPAWLAART
jgi:putative hydrolase of the HAD superfamily